LLNRRHEFFRKLIHIGCSILPLSYLYYFSREQIIYISGFISIGFIFAEGIRNYSNTFQQYFFFIFSHLLREDEKVKKITGATFLFVSLTVIFIIFEKRTAVPAALILTLADSLAAIFGKNFGRRTFLNKSVTGSLTFFLCCNVILFILLPVLGLLNIVIAAILTIVEAKALPVSDNLTIPISACLLIEGAFLIKGVVL
jgi:dolichol kinase